MIGQQVSIAAARTHISALIHALGEPLPANDSPITHRFPTPEAVAAHGNDVLRGPRARTTAIVNAAHAVAENTVALHPGMPATELRTSLLGLRGIGEWTAAYVSMRILNEPDVLLSTDLAIIRAADELGIDLSSRQPSWSPWRSYATMHLWRHYLTSPRPTSRSSDHHNNRPPKDSTKKSIPPQSTPGR